MAAISAVNSGRSLRIMFQDEARFGRLPVIRSAWAPRGVRPTVEAAVERQFKYVYGAVSPIEGELDWAVMNSMKTENMSEFLDQVACAHPDDYILMVLDGASSHKSKELRIPEHMQLLGLPPYSPELNPVESLWDHARERACANTFFDRLEDVVEAVADSLEKLSKCAYRVASMFCWPWIIMSI